MTTLIMPSDYGMEMLVGSSPIVGSGFMGGSPCLNDYGRCASMWSHAPPSAACLTDSVTTIKAKPISSFTHSFGISVNSPFDDGPPNGAGLGEPFFRAGPNRSSTNNSTRKRKVGIFQDPLQLQNLKSCLVSRGAEEQSSDDPVSPTREKKKVSFADMTGGDLAHVKIITERPDCPPRWSQDFLEQLTGGAKAEAISSEWTLTFSQPAADYLTWKNKLEKDNIALENVAIKEAESLLTGTVKVRNISFEKHVIVRYTTTNWVTHDEVEAKYLSTPMSGSSYNLYDTFTFDLPLPKTAQADKLEFCLCYFTDGQAFWDNNNNKNYAVVSFKSKKPESTKKPMELHDINMESWSEFSAWNHLDLRESPYW